MHAAALDALLARVRATLRPVPDLPDWKAKASGGGHMQPNFRRAWAAVFWMFFRVPPGA